LTWNPTIEVKGFGHNDEYGIINVDKSGEPPNVDIIEGSTEIVIDSDRTDLPYGLENYLKTKLPTDIWVIFFNSGTE